MTCLTSNNTLNPNIAAFIKSYQSEFIAVEGVNLMERLNLSDLRIPYKQVLKGRIILKAGQSNYLLNHLGMGDNATFLLIKPTYDVKSLQETDNFIKYSYFSAPSVEYTFSSVLLLTGNSENRVEQLYLCNPNQTREVILDIMVATIDNNYTFFPAIDTTITFNNLTGTDIITWIIGNVIAILGSNGLPQAYLNISDISAWVIDDKKITVSDDAYGTVYLNFTDHANAKQAASEINYILRTGGATGSVTFDIIAPVIIWSSHVFLTGATISATSSLSGLTYSAGTISLTDYTYLGGGEYSITKFDLSNYLIDKVVCGGTVTPYYAGTPSVCNACIIGTADSPNFNNSGCYRIYDNRDGLITLSNNNIIITKASTQYTDIHGTGSYTISFNISDIAGNFVNQNIKINLIVN